MAITDRAGQLARIRQYCETPPRAVLFDEPGGTLLDVASGKALPLELAQLERVEERVNSQTHQPYLILVYGDGRQLAVSEFGVAFSPDFQNTGPIAELPEVVCLRDYATLMERLKHDLYGHPDRPPTRDTLKLFLMCIAVLDGARAIGFEVGKEEKETEVHLRELEKRAPPPEQGR